MYMFTILLVFFTVLIDVKAVASTFTQTTCRTYNAASLYALASKAAGDADDLLTSSKQFSSV